MNIETRQLLLAAFAASAIVSRRPIRVEIPDGLNDGEMKKLLKVFSSQFVVKIGPKNANTLKKYLRAIGVSPRQALRKFSGVGLAQAVYARMEYFRAKKSRAGRKMSGDARQIALGLAVGRFAGLYGQIKRGWLEYEASRRPKSFGIFTRRSFKEAAKKAKCFISTTSIKGVLYSADCWSWRTSVGRVIAGFGMEDRKTQSVKAMACELSASWAYAEIIGTSFVPDCVVYFRDKDREYARQLARKLGVAAVAYRDWFPKIAKVSLGKKEISIPARFSAMY